MKITLKELKELGACSEGVELFETVFGQEAEVKTVVERLHEGKYFEYEGWLLSQTPGLTRMLLDNGADVHAEEDFALFWAVKDGHAEVVRLLLERGADVHAYKDVILYMASTSERKEIIELIEKAAR